MYIKNIGLMSDICQTTISIFVILFEFSILFVLNNLKITKKLSLRFEHFVNINFQIQKKYSSNIN